MNKFIEIAIEEAKKASEEGNVPVGAVIVKNNEIIASCHNTKNTSNIAINHAEILCIIEASKTINSWYLNECEIYVTLKPCEMCMAALAEARINKIYYLLDSNYEENLSKNINNIKIIKINEYESKYNKMVSEFFEKLRN